MISTKLFDREILKCLASGDEPEGYKIMENLLEDHSRWGLQYCMVFKYEDKYYRTHYSRGATEYQDESPYEYEAKVVPCTLVEPKEVVRIEYVPVTTEREV